MLKPSAQSAFFFASVAVLSVFLMDGGTQRLSPPQKKSCSTQEDCIEGQVCVAVASENLCLETAGHPPTKDVMRLALLGRRAAAADIAWMITVQFIGRPTSEAVAYEGLGDWIDLIVELSPDFRLAYFTGGILLSILPDKYRKADRILSRGEQAIDDYEFSLWRGFSAQYGALNPEKAARHYMDAYYLSGQEWIRSLADGARKAASSCAQTSQVFSRFRREGAGLGMSSQVLSREQEMRSIQHCVKKKIQRAEVQYRLLRAKGPKDINELIEIGALSREELLAPPGQCWTLQGRDAVLQPCSSNHSRSPRHDRPH